MPKYKVRASYSGTSDHSAEVEIEATSRAKALTQAKDMDERGELRWREESFVEKNETEYSVIEESGDEKVLLELTGGQINLLRSLLYGAMSKEDDTAQSDLLDTLVDQFEQCMGDG